MAWDFEVKPGLTFGEWLHRELKEEFAFEKPGWAIEQVITAAPQNYTRYSIVSSRCFLR